MTIGLVACIMLAAPASAFAGSLDLASDAPVALSGTLALSLDAGSLVSYDAQAEGPLVLHGATGRLTVWGWNATRAGVAHPLGSVAVANQIEDAHAQTFPLAGSDLTLDLRREPLALRVVPADGAVLRVTSLVEDDTAPAFVGLPVASAVGGGVSPYRQPDEVPWRWDAGWLFYGEHDNSAWPSPWLRLDAPTARLEGAFRLQMLGGNLTFTDETGRTQSIRLGVWSTSGPAALPGQTTQIETIRWAIFEGTLAATDLPLRGAWGGATPTPEWTLRGAMAWRNATGTIVTDGAQRHVVDEPVLLTGELVVRPRASSSGPTRYAGEGDLAHALLAGHDVLPDRPTLAPAAQASLAVAAAGLLGAAWALYTRVRGGKPLDHPMRRAIYESVVAHPGIYKRELQRAVGCGWGAFQFHFRALERPGYLRTQAQGKYLLVFAGHVKPTQTLTVVPNPLARRIYEAIPEGRAVPLHDLRVEMGISYQLLKYHLRGLEARGLVQRVDQPTRAVSIMRRPLLQAGLATDAGAVPAMEMGAVKPQDAT